MEGSGVVTAGVAQRIVERTMQQLGHNVNVMDDAGVIIGTGDVARLGIVHEGALLAIRGRRTMVVDEEVTDRLAGVRPGVNMPLVVDGVVVGAIGVSGDPSEVGQVADLLRLTAELMIEQAVVMDRDQWQASRYDALVQAMISADSAETVAAIAADLDVDLEIERRAAIIMPRSPQLDVLREVRRALHRGRLSVLTHRPESGILLVLVPATAEADEILRDLGPMRRKVAVAFGGRFGAAGLAASYASALDAMGSRQPAHEALDDVVAYADDPFTALIVGLAGGWRAEALASSWLHLREVEPELARTLVVYVDEGGDVTRCSQALRVHRNTLRNRLDRVHRITGVAVGDVRGMAELITGAILSGDMCMRTTDGHRRP